MNKRNRSRPSVPGATAPTVDGTSCTDRLFEQPCDWLDEPALLGRRQYRLPPGSEEIAAAWGPWMEVCIEAFGPARCMFESNFPVQKRWSSYQTTWNAFKRIAAGASADEKRDLFAGAAEKAYRLV